MSRKTDELFREARKAGKPRPEDLARARRGLDAKLAAAGLTVAVGAAATKAAATGSLAPKAATTVAVSTIVKLLCVVGIAGGAATAGYEILGADTSPSESTPASAIPAAPRTAAPAPVPAPTAQAPQPTPTPTPAPASTPAQTSTPTAAPVTASAMNTASVASSSPAPRAARLAPSAEPLPEPVLRVDPPPAPSAPPVASAPAPTVAEHLAEEIAILRAIDDALRRGDGASALAGVEKHAAQFPAGAMVEEREAARVLAMCALGRRDDAVKLADRFRVRFPRSPASPRLDASCVSSR